MSKVSARQVNTYLSAFQRQRCVECAPSFLNLCGDNLPEHLLKTIVMGNEIVIHCARGNPWNADENRKHRQEGLESVSVEKKGWPRFFEIQGHPSRRP